MNVNDKTIVLSPLEVEALYGLVRIVEGVQRKGAIPAVNRRGIELLSLLVSKLAEKRSALPGMLGMTEDLISQIVAEITIRAPAPANKAGP